MKPRSSSRNPCRAGSVKPPPQDRRRVQPWPVERVAAVREALPDRYAVPVDLCAGLGLRQGEALGLAVDDVDFLRGVVHVRRQVTIVGSRLVFAPPKGGRARDVPLQGSVSLRLAAYLRAFVTHELTLQWHPTGSRRRCGSC
jgi:integrase